MKPINLLYQTWNGNRNLPNSIPFWKRDWDTNRSYESVKFLYLEDLLTKFHIPYKRFKPKHVQENKKYFFIIEPEWIELAFFYENVFHFIDDEVLQQIQNPNLDVNILMFFPTEGFSLDMEPFLKSIVYSLQSKAIPPEKLYFVFGDLRFKENFESYRQLHPEVHCDINTFGWDVFSSNYKLEYDCLYKRGKDAERNKSTDLIDEIDTDTIRDKIFLCKNANPRPHRVVLLSQIYKMGWDKYGIISFLNRYFTPNPPSVDYYDAFLGKDSHEAFKYGEEFLSKTPIVLDYNKDSINEDLNQRRLVKEHFEQTYFSLVTETVVENKPHEPLFLSEKVYMPMVNYHPMLVLGGSRTLETLKEQGYETFPELFNEAYDEHHSKKHRYKIVWENLKRIIEMDKKELHKIYVDIIPKLKHNHDLYINKNHVKEYKPLWEFLDV